MTAALTPGTAIGPLSIDPISRTTLALFAGSSGDHMPFHIDIDAAKSAGMDDVFAHGMLSMAYLGRLLTDNFGVENLRSFKVRFSAITPVYGQPTCRGTVRTIDDAGGQRLATLDLIMALADGTTTLIGEAVVAIDRV